MMRLWPRRLLTIAIALVCGLVDATVGTWLPGDLQAIRWSFPFIVLLAIFSIRERSLIAAATSGLVLDVLLPSSWGGVTVRFVFVAIIVHALGARLFSNRSLLGAWTLGGIALVSDRAFLIGMQMLLTALGTSYVPEVHAALWAELAWLLFGITIVFVVFAAFTKRFLPSLHAQTNSRFL